MNTPLTQVEIRNEHDVVQARQRARAVASRLGFEPMDQARIATAVSEIARNAIQYAGSGRVEFALEGESPQALAIRVVDRGPGLREVASQAESPGEPRANVLQGIDGARRMMDGFAIEPEPGGGTVVTMTKALPRRAPTIAPIAVARLIEELSRLDPPSPIDELLRQNHELLKALDDLRVRELELAQLNRELEDTNRGVLALYLELDERADSLKRASEMKTRFLSNISHELRTPLTSILSLSRLLLDRTDGDLSVEQDRQAGFILRAAQDLTTMVNDLLDLARIEAGRELLHLDEVDLVDLFGALRGMLRPILKPDSRVELVFDDPAGLPMLYTDEGKLAQILRNLLSNALKFTEDGEVRIHAGMGPGDLLVVEVTDTGIGIEPIHLDRIFEEFGQVDSLLQRKFKGTGLGLPLSRKLAELLGGGLDVRSVPGAGSTFTVTLPINFPGGDARGPDGSGRPLAVEVEVEVKERANDA